MFVLVLMHFRALAFVLNAILMTVPACLVKVMQDVTGMLGKTALQVILRSLKLVLSGDAVGLEAGGQCTIAIVTV